jgi:hypothetical protein
MRSSQYPPSTNEHANGVGTHLNPGSNDHSGCTKKDRVASTNTIRNVGCKDMAAKNTDVLNVIEINVDQ